MPAPSVHSYLDYRAFLRDWFAARKQADPDYSYAVFAEAGGCAKSSLANAISGTRRPRPDTLDAFARAMELSPSERNHLGLLVDHASATSLDDRARVLQRILSAERYQQVRIAESDHDDAARYLEHWYVPVIRELVALPGFREEPEWIAARLRPRIRPEEARYALDLLLDLGFVSRDASGALVPEEIRFRTTDESFTEAAMHFHTAVVPELLQTVESANAAQQHLMAVTLTLPPELLPEAKAKINALVEQLATLADDRRTAGPHRIYQVAIQLLPVSDELGG